MSKERERQLRLQAQGLCITCGKNPTPISSRTGKPAVRCDDCRDRIHRSRLKGSVRLRAPRQTVAARIVRETVEPDRKLPWWMSIDPNDPSDFYRQARERFPLSGTLSGSTSSAA